MAWYDEAVFYHIYPLGMTGAPKQNAYEEPEHRLNTLIPWISHIKEIGCNALYIGPLFESVGHGYETTDYKKLDSRLGTNEDLTHFVKECHKHGIRVILDGVFNHTGRDFFAFQDIKKNRETSPYKDWYCNVNFYGNNEYNDGFCYDNWCGYNLLAKLNQKNPAVRDYLCDAIRFWVSEFDIDGIRLDAADVLDFNYMHALRQTANEVKPDFWLMGEVIHGDYTRWVNEGTLHSVTNYQLHKALYSGHNDHNYFEIAHTVKRLYEMGGNRPDGLKLYNFVDNHDVERIYTKLNNKQHFFPVHILMYTLPGVPSIYYGSEFGIEGKKERNSDDSLRPALSYDDYKDAINTNDYTKLIAALGKIRQTTKALSYGDYKQIVLTNQQYAFSRSYNSETVFITVNNSDNDVTINLPADNATEYVGALSGTKVTANGGTITVNVKGNFGEIWLPANVAGDDIEPMVLDLTEKVENISDKAAVSDMPEITTDNVVEQIQVDSVIEHSTVATSAKDTNIKETDTQITTPDVTTTADSTETQETQKTVTVPQNKTYEEMTIEELQEAILECMRKNGPITDQMLKDVRENVYHNSLVNWVKSFH